MISKGGSTSTFLLWPKNDKARRHAPMKIQQAMQYLSMQESDGRVERGETYE